jgi:hypothetical protein
VKEFVKASLNVKDSERLIIKINFKILKGKNGE